MKILAATNVNYYSDPRAFKIDEGLANKNEVFVLSPVKGKIENTKVKVFDYKEITSHVVFDLIKYWIVLVYYAIRLRPDVLIGHNYYVAFPCLIVKIFSPRTKTVYDSYELYIPSKRYKLKVRERIFYTLEKISIKSFNLILCANYERARLMKRKFRLKELPMSVPNISTVFFDEEPSNGMITQKYPSILSIKDSVKLVYQGFIGAGRQLDKFLYIINELPAKYSMLFIGGGPDLQSLKDLTNKLNISKRVVFLGNVPMKDVFPLISFCDYGLISYPFSDLNNIYCSPNKIYEYPAAGLPMISSKQNTIVTILKKYNITCFVDYNDISGSARKISEFVDSSNAEDIKHQIELFLKENNWQNVMNDIEKRINGLV